MICSSTVLIVVMIIGILINEKEVEGKVLMVEMYGGISVLGEYVIPLHLIPSEEEEYDQNIQDNIVPTTNTKEESIFLVQIDTGSSSLLIPAVISSSSSSSSNQQQPSLQPSSISSISSSPSISFQQHQKQRIEENELIKCNSSLCGSATCSSSTRRPITSQISQISTSTSLRSSSTTSSLKSTTKSSIFESSTLETISSSSSNNNNNNDDLSSSCPSGICSEVNEACCSRTEPEACGFFIRYGGNDLRYRVTAEGVMMKERIGVEVEEEYETESTDGALNEALNEESKDDKESNDEKELSEEKDKSSEREESSDEQSSNKQPSNNEQRQQDEQKQQQEQHQQQHLLQNQNKSLSKSIVFGKDNAIIYLVLDRTGQWPTEVDGILGLGYPSLNCNPTCSEPAFETLLDTSNNIFTICMGDTKGKILFGSNGIKEGITIGTIKWTPILSDLYSHHSFYVIEMKSMIMEREGYDLIEIGSRILDEMGKGRKRWDNGNNGNGNINPIMISKIYLHEIIVDSGTTLLLLNEYIYRAFVFILRRDYCHIAGICGAIEDTIFTPGMCLIDIPKYQMLPKLIMRFGDEIEITINPELYFVRYLDVDASEEERQERGCEIPEEYKENGEDMNGVDMDDLREDSLDGNNLNRNNLNRNNLNRNNLSEDNSNRNNSSGNNSNGNNSNRNKNENINNLLPLCYVYCFGIQSSGNSPSILGDVVLRGFSTIFDRKSSRIGFAKSNRTNCGYVSDLNENGNENNGEGGGDNDGGIMYDNRLIRRQHTLFVVSLMLAGIATSVAICIIGRASGVIGTRAGYQQIR